MHFFVYNVFLCLNSCEEHVSFGFLNAGADLQGPLASLLLIPEVIQSMYFHQLVDSVFEYIISV